MSMRNSMESGNTWKKKKKLCKKIRELLFNSLINWWYKVLFLLVYFQMQQLWRLFGMIHVVQLVAILGLNDLELCSFLYWVIGQTKSNMIDLMGNEWKVIMEKVNGKMKTIDWRGEKKGDYAIVFQIREEIEL